MDNDALLKLGPALAQYISYAMAALSCLSVFSALVAWRKRRNEQVPARCSTLAEIDAALSTSWDAFSEAVPGVLVVVGLLGTFFGLAQAISEAGHAIQTHPITVSGAGALDQPRPDILSGLMPVLAGMGVKFKSSIWGISSSLVMRAFAHVFVRAPRKRRALAKFRELSEQPDRLQQVCDELRAQQDLFDQMLDEERRQSAAASELLAANGAQAEALLQRHDAQKQVQDSLLKSVGGMAQQMPTATGLQSIANKLDLLKNTLDESWAEQNKARKSLAVLDTTAVALGQGAAGISNAASQMAMAAGSLQSALDALKAETKNMADAGVSQMREGQKALTKATADLKTGIDGAMAGFQEKVTQAMTQMTTDLSGVTSGIQEAVDRSSVNLRDGVAGLTTSVGALDSRIGTALGHIETAVGDLAKHMHALNAQIEVMRQAEEQQKDANKRMVEVVENVAQEAAKIAQQVRAGERNNLKQVVDAVDALTVQVTQGNTTVCTGLGDVVKTIQDSGRESRALSEKLAGTLAPLGQAATQASATKRDVQREDALSTNAAGARDAQGVKVTIALAGSGAAGVAPGSPAATPQSPSSSGPPQAANARPGSPVGPRVQAPPSAPVAAPIPHPPVHTPAPVASGVRPAAGPPPATAAAGAAGATGASPPAPAQAKSIEPSPPAVVPANKKG